MGVSIKIGKEGTRIFNVVSHGLLHPSGSRPLSLSFSLTLFILEARAAVKAKAGRRLS
jgi:hypothetical protein